MSVEHEIMDPVTGRPGLDAEAGQGRLDKLVGHGRHQIGLPDLGHLADHVAWHHALDCHSCKYKLVQELGTEWAMLPAGPFYRVGG